MTDETLKHNRDDSPDGGPNKRLRVGDGDWAQDQRLEELLAATEPNFGDAPNASPGQGPLDATLAAIEAEHAIEQDVPTGQDGPAAPSAVMEQDIPEEQDVPTQQDSSRALLAIMEPEAPLVQVPNTDIIVDPAQGEDPTGLMQGYDSNELNTVGSGSPAPVVNLTEDDGQGTTAANPPQNEGEVITIEEDDVAEEERPEDMDARMAALLAAAVANNSNSQDADGSPALALHPPSSNPASPSGPSGPPGPSSGPADPSLDPAPATMPASFHYFRPGKPHKAARGPVFNRAPDNDEVLLSIDYDFSDESDAEDGYQVSWNPDTEEPDSGSGDEYSQYMKPTNPGERPVTPPSPRNDEDNEEHARVKALYKSRVDAVKNWKDAVNKPFYVHTLTSMGLAINRMLRMYRNGSRPGQEALGYDKTRPQGVEIPSPPRSVKKSSGRVANYNKGPYPRQGLKVLARRRRRLREALQSIDALLKWKNPGEPETVAAQIRLRGDIQFVMNKHKWFLKRYAEKHGTTNTTNKSHEQGQVSAEISAEASASALYGLDMLSAQDLNNLSRISMFADAKWQAPREVVEGGEAFWSV